MTKYTYLKLQWLDFGKYVNCSSAYIGLKKKHEKFGVIKKKDIVLSKAGVFTYSRQSRGFTNAQKLTFVSVRIIKIITVEIANTFSRTYYVIAIYLVRLYIIISCKTKLISFQTTTTTTMTNTGGTKTTRRHLSGT